MRKILKVFIFQVILFAFVCEISGVPVIPNRAVVIGIVEEVSVTTAMQTPDRVIYKLRISIEKTEDIAGSPNFVKSRAASSLTAYSEDKNALDLYGEKVKAIVEFKGDERGGNFWIKQINVVDNKGGV